jgi:hypothetical protein
MSEMLILHGRLVDPAKQCRRRCALTQPAWWLRPG